MQEIPMTEVYNDAQTYGVKIIPAQVEAGQPYWKVTRIHHLTPQENQYHHHIFLDARDEEGNRIHNTTFLIKWDGGSDIVALDKQSSPRGAAFPMWKWQICSVEVRGEPSDRIINLRTDHPKDGEGNDMFLHSFAITYTRAIAQEPIQPAEGILEGKVPGGGGHTIALIDEANESRTMLVGADERYHFANLKTGNYLLHNLSNQRIVGPIHISGDKTTRVDFPPSLPANKISPHFFLFEDLTTPAAQTYLSLLADHLARNNIPFGSDIVDATLSAKVWLVGEHTPAVEQTLLDAGSQVIKLPTDPAALIDALESL